METIQVTDLTLWQAFVAVYRTQSFTAAAKKLRWGVPTLSKKIGVLESTLGSRLFTRSTRRVSPTQEAQDLFPRVESLLELARENESRPKADAIEGLIRIATIPAFAQRWLAPRLLKFQQKYPKIDFELQLSDALVDLVESGLDLALRVQEPTGADFVFRKLFENALVLCASPAYLKAHGEPRQLADLRRHPLLMLSIYEECRFLPSGPRLGEFKKSSRLRCENGAMLTELALQGAGIAVRSHWDVEESLRKGTLKKLLPRHPLEPLGHLYAVTPHRSLLPRRVQAFLEFLSEEAARTARQV